MDSVILYEEETLLHRAIENYFVELSKLLMEMGYDVNARHGNGATPLWFCVNRISDKKVLTEIATALLCYGADPNLEYVYDDSKNLFEHAVKLRTYTLQEALFHYMIDDYNLMDVDFETLLILARRRSPFFRGTVEHCKDVFVVSPLTSCFQCLFSIDIDYLDALIKKCPDAIRTVLSVIKPFSRGKFFEKRFLENLSLLVESDLREDTLCLIDSVKYDMLYIGFLTEFPVDHSVPLEHLCFLLSCGVSLPVAIVEILYSKYGFGELIKILMHMEIESNYLEMHDTCPMVLLLYNVHFDLHTFLENPYERHNPEYLSEFLHYFSDAKLQACCSNGVMPENVATIIANQPTVPLLVELARNAFRKYFVKTFQIKNAGHFYKLVTKLPIAPEHQKIITFEKQLY